MSDASSLSSKRAGARESLCRSKPSGTRVSAAPISASVSGRIAVSPGVYSAPSRSIPDHHTGIPGLYLANTTQVYPEDRGQNYSLLLGEKAAGLIDEDGRPQAVRPDGTIQT